MPAAFSLQGVLPSFPSPCVAFYLSSSMGCKDTISLIFLHFTIKFVVIFEVCVASWDHSEPVGAPPTPPLGGPLLPVVLFPSKNGGLVGSKRCAEAPDGEPGRGPSCCPEKRRLQGTRLDLGHKSAAPLVGVRRVRHLKGRSCRFRTPRSADLGLPDQGKEAFHLVLLCWGPFWR